MAETPLAPAALQQKRQRAIARLCEHFARDHIGVEELEQLIDRAHQAVYPAELSALFTDLPALDTSTGPAAVPATERRDQQVIVAIMGGAQRRGAWVPARTVYVISVMGGALLDFRDARMDPGVIEVTVVAIMGGTEIIVPPGMRVESDGIGIMGGFGHVGAAGQRPDLPGPTLRVSGVAIMGGVEIRERAIGEPARPGKGRGRRASPRGSLGPGPSGRDEGQG
jgi:hypothetical protein